MSSILWDHDEPVATYVTDMEPPEWIGEGITPADVAAINQGGCASGAWMDAVTYHKAAEIMGEHGNDVLEYIENDLGEIPQPPQGSGWSALAVFYLSMAVELWCSSVADELETAIELDGD